MDNFQGFYKEQKDKIFSYLMRMTGDYHLSMDIMQESFLRCLEKYKDKMVNNTLLYRIARNLIIDHSRKVKRKREFEQNSIDEQNSRDDFYIKQEYRQVMEAMKNLENDEREILSLVLTENLKYKEIASIMGIKENNVKVKVHRARTRLREILQQGDLS